MKLKSAAQAATVEIELAASTLAAITGEAERTGRTVDEVIAEKLRECVARSQEEEVTVRLGFTQAEWRRLEGKAKLADCSALAMLNTARDLLANTDDLVPCWLPQRTVNRLWQVAEACDIDADSIAERILGDFTADPAGIRDMVAMDYPDATPEQLTALEAVLAGWAKVEA